MSNKFWGFLGIVIVLVGILICAWLTIQGGFLNKLQHNTPIISVPLSLIPPGTPAQGSSASSYTVVGPPTLGAAFVNHVLAQAHSPAQGTGQALYNLSKQYGIDDAYALAFFQHESQFGTTGVARVTQSLGNIRCTPGYHCLDGFRAYGSWQAGYQDWYALIRNLYVKQWHRRTVAAIIPLYAPSSDGNDPASYITAVEQAVTTWRREASAS